MNPRDLYMKLLHRYGIDPDSTHVSQVLYDLVEDSDLRAMVAFIGDTVASRANNQALGGMAVALAALMFRAGYEEGHKEGMGGVVKSGTKLVLPDPEELSKLTRVKGKKG
jgi:hypothetical protein